MKTKGNLSHIPPEDFEKIQGLKETTSSIVNMIIMPLIKKLNTIAESDVSAKQVIKEQLEAIKAEYLSKHNELVELCNKYGIIVRIITAEHEIHQTD